MNALVYANENDAGACHWLSCLPLHFDRIDNRSIVDVTKDDLNGYSQCHFFAGIGGWPYALQLAGWPADSPVWTGSCPCQPFSAAGKRKGNADDRHLWSRSGHSGARQLEASERTQPRVNAQSRGVDGFWSTADYLYCSDGKYRPVEPGTFPLAHGIPGRVAQLRGLGNAIVPQDAAEFIRAFVVSGVTTP